MKHPRAAKLASFFLIWLMSALTSVSAVLCLAESFQLGGAPEKLAAICIGAALLLSLSTLPKRRGLLAAAEAALLLLGICWQWPQIAGSWQLALRQVTTTLSRFFSVPSLGVRGGDPIYVLALAGILLAWAAVRAWNGGSVLPLTAVCAPVLTLCLLIVNIAPLLWLVLLTGALLLLLVTQSARARSSVQGNCLAWRLLPAVAALLTAVILLFPPETYQRTDWITLLQETAENGVDLKIDMASPIQLPFSSSWSGKLRKLDLSQLGPKEKTGTHTLDFCAETEISYLRGVSLGIYRDQTWSAVNSSAFRAADFVRQPQITGGRDKKRLDIRTDSRMDLLYTTYQLAATPADGAAVDDAYWSNHEDIEAYTTFYSKWVLVPDAAYDRYVLSQYLQLPEELEDPLAQYCQENELTGASAETIAGHVRRAGVYDLDTPQTPEGEDFVLHFLQKSHRGYCVHFASAAALLLRSQGIPARYVSGYAVSNQPGTWTAVTEDQAHAWVEYYQQGAGWQVLDPTPADEQSGEESSLPIQGAEEPTAPDETPDPEEPVEPDRPEPEKSEENADSPAEPEASTRVDALPQETRSDGIRWLLPPAVAALLMLCVAARRWLILHRRRRACAAQDPNASLLAYWRWLTQLWKVSGHSPDPALRLLAEKARFSQHSASPEELDTLRQAAEAEVRQLRAEPSRWKRLWRCWGLALY